MKKIITTLILLLLVSACQKGNKEVSDYAETLFDTSYIHEINVEIAKEDYDDLLKNPTDKTKYTVDVVIDGERYEEVSFATKGNSSLFFVADDENSDRYSYKINFSKNIKDQRCHGLDKLNLNNMYKDATYMKDFISYDMFRNSGIDTPLAAYTKISFNGVEHGLYLMVEDIDKSFLIRNRDGKGVIYKPEADLDLDMEQIAQIKESGLNYDVEVNGADFIYIDDNPESYSDIFENNVTHSEEADELRVIEALKGLKEGKELDKHLDTDELIRYFALQVFLMNYDSYIGPMLHNYFLYENEGRLSLFPWDYNLAFLTFDQVLPEDAFIDATPYINYGIDTPLYLTKEENRPMWKWIQEDEGYTQKYHEAMKEIIDKYFSSGMYEKKIDELSEQLRPYVENDPSAFYDVTEFDKACEALKIYGQVRSMSVLKQLNGELSAYNDSQDKKDMVDASMLKLGDMQ